MKSKSTLRIYLLFAGSSLLAISSVQAQSGNWAVDAAGDWSLDTNWSPVAVPGNAAGDIIGLNNDILGARTVTINTTPRTAGALNIGDSVNSHAFTLAASGGGSLTFDNSGSGATLTEIGAVSDIISAPVTLNDNLAASVAGSLTLSGVISETGGARSITKSGAGTIILSGNNSYSGGFTLDAGFVIIPAAGTYTGLGTGTLTINGGQISLPFPGAAFAFTTANNSVWNGNFNVYRGQTAVATWNHNGNVTLGGNVTVNSTNNGWITNINGVVGETGGARSLALAGNGLTLSLNNANTYTGGTTTGTGSLNINNASAIGTGTLNINGGAIDNTSGGAVTLSTNNPVNITANFPFTGTNSLNLGTGNVTINGTRQVTVTANRLTLGGNVGAIAAGFNKLGAGTLALTGAASVNTGATTISAGVLEVSTFANGAVASSIGSASNAAASLLFGAATSTLRYVGSTDASTNRSFTLGGALGGGATIESSGSGTLSFDNTVALAYGATNQPRTLILGGTNTGANTFGKAVALANNGTGSTPLSANFALNATTVTLESVTGVSTGASITGTGIAPGTTLTAIDTNTRVVTLSTPATGAGTAAQAMTVTGVVNPVSLTKTGAGKWILSQSNTYTGPTAINGGTLVMTGATQATSAITFGGGVLGLDIASPVAAASATVNFTGQQVLVTGATGSPSYTLLSANSITGVPTLASPVPGYSLQVVTNELRLVQTGGSPYATWSGGVAFDEDANNDGVKNGLAFLLGAVSPTVNATGLLPVASQGGGNLTLTFTMRNSAARAPSQVRLQHSSDLGISDPWSAFVTVPETSGTTSGITFTITAGATTNTVVASIPSSEAAAGKLFGRLNGIE